MGPLEIGLASRGAAIRGKFGAGLCSLWEGAPVRINRETLHAGWERLVWGEGETERGFALRMFCSSCVVFVLFLNPYVQSSMTWNFLDLAASLVETGRPYLTHTTMYGGMDTARTPWGTASGEPLGPSLALLPLCALFWVIGRPEAVPLPVVNLCGVLTLSIPAAGLIAVLIYLQARRFGSDERCCRMVAWFGALGTQVFPLSTMYTKELLGATAGLAAFHLASLIKDQKAPPNVRRSVIVGSLASVAGLMVYPLWILVPGLAWYLRPSLPGSGLAALWLGASPAALLLLVYNQATFGHPFLVGYMTLADPLGGRVAWPSLRMLWDLTVGPTGGLMLYHPLLALVPVAFWVGWQRPAMRRDLAFAAGLFLALLFVYGAWLEPYHDNKGLVASLGLRMLLPAVPLLVCLLAGLTGKWRVVMGWLGILAILSSVAFASSGLIPSQVLPALYIAKVATTTMASGLLFADGLPRLMGIQTLHLAIAGQQIPTANIWENPDLPALVARQFVFRLISLAFLLAAAVVLVRVRFERSVGMREKGSPS
jgi:hypothetical protein